MTLMLKLFPSLCRPSPRLINIDAPLLVQKMQRLFGRVTR